MEWLITALKAVPPHTVSNCWIACKILTLEQMHDLEVGMRRNNRDSNTRTQATAGVSQEVIDELSSLLSNLGKSLAVNKNTPIPMLEAVELLDMELEREVFEHHSIVIGDLEDGDSNVEEDEDEPSMLEGETNGIKLCEVGQVDDKEPSPTLSLAQAKDMTEKLFNFVSENNLLIIQAGTSRSADYVSMADTLRFAIQRMNISKATRQTSISEFMTGSNSTN